DRGAQVADARKWLNTPLKGSAAQAKTLSFGDSRTLTVRRLKGAVEFYEGKTLKLRFERFGPPRKPAPPRFVGISMLTPALGVNLGRQQDFSGLNGTPEGALTSLLADLGGGNPAWKKHLSPRLSSQQRLLAVKAFETMLPGVKRLVIRSRVRTAWTAKTSHSITWRMSQILTLLYGPHDVMLFAETQSNKDDVFVGCRHIEGKWVITGIVSVKSKASMALLQAAFKTHKRSKYSTPISRTWMRMKTPIELKTGLSWPLKTGDPLVALQSLISAVARKDEGYVSAIWAPKRTPIMQRQILSKLPEKSQAIAIRAMPAGQIESVKKWTRKLSPWPLTRFAEVLIRARLSQPGKTKYVLVQLGQNALSAWRVLRVRGIAADRVAAMLKPARKPHPALKVAEAVLEAINDQDARALRSHLNNVNRRKIPLVRIPRVLKKMKRRTRGHSKVLEIRKGPKYLGALGVAVKFGEDQHDALVLMLSFEDGTYRFEDINSPSLKRYEKKALIWSR
ncbi:MAG TPA: hypothetical protein DCQ06_04195, partial [Myxococcales bacterium]|nr:hypothetical protein [Myxococcales bacterium]